MNVVPHVQIPPRFRMTTAFRAALLALLAGVTVSAPLAGQHHDRPQKYNAAAVVAGNAALGSLTVALGHVFRSKRPSFAKLAQGAVGGATVFAGKAIAADRHWYTGVAGRQVASFGGSAIQNVAAGRGYADRVLLPWGPIRFHVETRGRVKVHPKFDVAGVVATVMGITGDDLEIDVERSLKYGTVVLRNVGMSGDATAVGSHIGGVIKYRRLTVESTAASRESVDAVIAHELVHVIQSDFLFNAWAGPVESYALGKSTVGKTINRYVDLGLHVPFAAWLNGVVDYPSRPWEREAVSLVSTPQEQ